MVEQMKVLEQQVQKLMEYVTRLKEDKSRLETRLQEGERLLQNLQQERLEVRGRIERMLGDLKGVEEGDK